MISNMNMCVVTSYLLTHFKLYFRFLSTGTPYRSLAFSFRMAHNTMSGIIYETCNIIWNVFGKIHMPFPTKDMFYKIAHDFETLWNFPNCIGCIDGKHIRIKCPKKTGSMFYNYKN